MKLIAPFVLALGFSVAGLSAACATEGAGPATHPYHHPRHHAYHHLPVVRDAAPAPAPTAAAAPQAAPLGLALPRIAPYPDGKGDEDGLSDDRNDCNKGCIDGNTPD
jgi:hypothetical protein